MTGLNDYLRGETPAQIRERWEKEKAQHPAMQINWLPERRPIQIHIDGTTAVVLCNDGTMWQCDSFDHNPKWIALPPIPQP